MAQPSKNVFQVAVTSTATALSVYSGQNFLQRVFQNLGTDAIFLGDSDVDDSGPTGGIRVLSGGFWVDFSTKSNWFAVCAGSGTATVAVVEITGAVGAVLTDVSSLGGPTANSADVIAVVDEALATSPDIHGTDAAQGLTLVMRGGNSSTSGNAGGLTSLTGGTGGLTGAGGAANLTGGTPGATSGTGGAVNVVGGAGQGVTTTGGAAAFRGGAGGVGTSTSAGGVGGATAIASGAGGAKTDTGTAAGGAAGALTVTGGAGGATANSSTSAGGAGADITITGGVGGAATAGTGNGGVGGDVNIVGGAGGASTGAIGGTGGNIAFTPGAAGATGASKGGISRFTTTATCIAQPTPATTTTATTLTIAQLLTRIIVATPSAGSTAAYVLPTGTLMQSTKDFQDDDSFDWTIINVAAASADTITVTAGVGHTLVGAPIVPSAHATTIQLSSCTFRSRRISSAVWETYKV